MAIGSLAELERDDDDRVVVVGTGLGGATLALRLAAKGRRVLLLERGGHLRTPVDPVRVGRFIIDVHGDRSKPIEYVGGQTKFYGAALYRLRESDFRAVEHESGVSPAWPFGYEELEPYYAEAERIYRVHGSSEGDPCEPPRNGSYPYPPLEHAPSVGRLVKRLADNGVPVSRIPRGLDHRPGGACVLCPNCDAHLCTVDGKMDAEIAAVRPALATGRVELVTHTDVLKILTDGRRVAGLLVRRDGEEVVLRARTVAICAGLPGSAVLLRRSATSRNRKGLGNAGGALGKYLGAHSTGMIFAMTGLAPAPAEHTKTFAINAYYERSPDWPYPTGVIQAAGQMPFWREAQRWMRPIAKAVGTRSIPCFYMTEALPTSATGLVFDGDNIAVRMDPVENLRTFRRLRALAVEAFRAAGYPSLARKRAPYIWHEVGTARMGDDPASSTVDATLQVHGVEGLYVADASVLPSAGAVNTGLTIAALAIRLGDHIAGDVSAPAHVAAEGFA